MQFDRLKRREFIIRVGAAMAMWPIFAQAQETTLKRWRIGSLFPTQPGTINPLPAVLEQGLADLGYQNGRNISIITSNVPPQSEVVEEAIRALAPDIDILVVGGTISGIAAKKVAPQLPTVFCAVGAPVDIGLVQSLAHPGGNMTGVAFEAAIEAYGRRLQILPGDRAQPRPRGRASGVWRRQCQNRNDRNGTISVPTRAYLVGIRRAIRRRPRQCLCQHAAEQHGSADRRRRGAHLFQWQTNC